MVIKIRPEDCGFQTPKIIDDVVNVIASFNRFSVDDVGKLAGMKGICVPRFTIEKIIVWMQDAGCVRTDGFENGHYVYRYVGLAE